MHCLLAWHAPHTPDLNARPVFGHLCQGHTLCVEEPVQQDGSPSVFAALPLRAQVRIATGQRLIVRYIAALYCLPLKQHDQDIAVKPSATQCKEYCLPYAHRLLRTVRADVAHTCRTFTDCTLACQSQMLLATMPSRPRTMKPVHQVSLSRVRAQQQSFKRLRLRGSCSSCTQLGITGRSAWFSC